MKTPKTVRRRNPMSDKQQNLNMAPNMSAEQQKEEEELRQARNRIKHEIVVLSGKGGVGKSTVAVNLAVGLAAKGYQVGLLDIDMHGPNVPKMLGMEDAQIQGTPDEKLIPAEYSRNLKVMSVGFLSQNNEDAIIWRAALKHGVIRQFLKDVLWEDLDFLVVDSPPGTGDEPLSIVQLLEDPDGAVIVTTPQDVALLDVRKSVNFCRKLNLPVLGVVENMSGLVCPHCGETIDVFKTGGGEKMAGEMDVPFLGALPLARSILDYGDEGRPFAEQKDDQAFQAFQGILDRMFKEGGFEK
jgi:Mrp family chromosome partitioning ATPase